MNISEIQVPTLEQLQELFPLGVIDLDMEARREVNSIFAFRNILVRMTDPGCIDYVKTLLSDVMEDLAKEERAKQGIAEDDMSEASRHVSLNAIKVYGGQFKAIAAAMREKDSVAPGRHMAAVDNQMVMEKEAGEISRDRAFPASGRLGAMLAQVLSVSPVPLPMIQCVVHAAIHGMFREIVHGHLYRLHPGLRFPFHRLVVINVDVPDEATVLQATITGYQIPLLRSMQPQTLPDKLDSSMFEKGPRLGKILQDPGAPPKRNPPNQKDGDQI